MLLLEQQGASRVPVNFRKANVVARAKLSEAVQIGGNQVVLKSLVSLSRSKPLSIRSDGTGHPTEASYQGTSSFVPADGASYQGTNSFVPPLAPN